MAGEWLKRGRRWYFSAGLAALAPCACAPMPPQLVQPPQAYYPPPSYYVPRPAPPYEFREPVRPVPRPAPPQINAPDDDGVPPRHQQQTPSVIEQPGPVAVAGRRRLPVTGLNASAGGASAISFSSEVNQ
jgi:hypothetical protein